MIINCNINEFDKSHVINQGDDLYVSIPDQMSLGKFTMWFSIFIAVILLL